MIFVAPGGGGSALLWWNTKREYERNMTHHNDITIISCPDRLNYVYCVEDSPTFHENTKASTRNAVQEMTKTLVFELLTLTVLCRRRIGVHLVQLIPAWSPQIYHPFHLSIPGSANLAYQSFRRKPSSSPPVQKAAVDSPDLRLELLRPQLSTAT